MADNSEKLKIAILFGGRSAEHEVSVLSATNVMNALSPIRYEPVPIFVTREGKWLLSDFTDGVLACPSEGSELCLVPGGHGRMIVIPEDGAPRDFFKMDIVFPVLHGLHGEDGSVQGACEVARVPMAGCGIAGSANALDKDLAKRLFRDAGVPAARAITLSRGQSASFDTVSAELGLPVFVKPARQGSSVGVSKVVDAAGFAAALTEGFRHDDKLLIEEFVKGREIECAVLEGEDGNLFVSLTGEIAPAESHGFYSYDAKYVDKDGAALRVPAQLPEEFEGEIRRLAATAFRALGCDGMARADFFLTGDGRILVNELNTIPGFTDISMYSKVMAASGIRYAEVIDRLVAHGLARAARDI